MTLLQNLGLAVFYLRWVLAFMGVTVTVVWLVLDHLDRVEQRRLGVRALLVERSQLVDVNATLRARVAAYSDHHASCRMRAVRAIRTPERTQR